MNDAADHQTVVNARLAARVSGKMRRDLRRLRFRQPEVVKNHRRSFLESRESQRLVHAKLT
jgi:hypothetical protein